MSNTLRLRPLAIEDFHAGFLQVLEGLTEVGEVSEAQFIESFNSLEFSDNKHILVIEDLDRNIIIATGSLFIEQKFSHGCKKVGHIEDVSVLPNHQKNHLGITIVQHLVDYARDLGCYKVILQCTEANQSFYEKAGFKRCATSLSKYFEQPIVNVETI
ncbi:hypothetical protein RCL1_007150 [Eukaryota sp. TZLM3-RCL]